MIKFEDVVLTLALDEVIGLTGYCAEHKLEDFKKHSRELAKCIDGYDANLRKEYGDNYEQFREYVANIKSAIGLDRFKCWMSFSNEASRQYVGMKHKEIPGRLAFAMMLLTFAEQYEVNANNIIEDKVSNACSKIEDPYLMMISALLLDIAETKNLKLEITEIMVRCLAVIVRKCKDRVAEINSTEV